MKRMRPVGCLPISSALFHQAFVDLLRIRSAQRYFIERLAPTTVLMHRTVAVEV